MSNKAFSGRLWNFAFKNNLATCFKGHKSVNKLGPATSTSEDLFVPRKKIKPYMLKDIHCSNKKQRKDPTTGDGGFDHNVLAGW
jgi:hypothetical protein